MLTYEEANKLIVGYSKYYQTKIEKDDSTKNGYSWFSVYYKVPSVCFKQKEVAAVLTKHRFSIINTMFDMEEFSKLPCYDELWMTLSELAMTPIEDRESKFNIIVGQDDVDSIGDDAKHCVVWRKDLFGERDNYFYLDKVKYDDLDRASVLFSEKDYQALLEFIKHLPNSGNQVDIAKAGRKSIMLDRED